LPIVDLTHLIEPTMPVFPGTEPPVLAAANSIAHDGFAEKKITMFSHTGTHIDAPAHMLTGARSLDAYPARDFYGRAVLADVSASRQEYIGLEHLAGLEESLKRADFLILRTGWAERWGSPAYFDDFPALTPAAAHWVLGFGLKGIGTDAISIDRMPDHAFPIHYLLFGAGLFVIENLAHLDQVGREFTLACFPLYLQHADGAPVRAVAFVD
jgi:arylformamidase